MTAPMTMTNCPIDPNLLAAFVDGRLHGNERRTVIEHLASCAECSSVLLSASERDASELETARPHRPYWVPAAVVAVAAVLAIALFLAPAVTRLSHERRMKDLAAAVQELDERRLEARTTIDTVYRTHRSYRGGTGDASSYAVFAAAIRLAEAAKQNPTVANLHGAGVAYLMLENTESHNYKKRGVELLEEAVRKETSLDDTEAAIGRTTNARLLNDLAAGYHAIGEHRRAIGAVTRAWTLERSPTTAWTRAVILQSSDAWREYLAIDDTPGWSDEARRRLRD